MPIDPAGELGPLTGARVLVVGDIMLDRFVTGSVERISPEGPVPVLRVERETATLGGAGNVLRGLQALGAQAKVIAVIGEDAAGQEVQHLLETEDDGASSLVVLPGCTTTLKERFIAGPQQLLRADRETSAGLPETVGRELLETARAALVDAAALVLSDYGKGVLSPALLTALIEAARGAGLPVVVDPRGRDYRIYRGASVVTPNRRELEAATGHAVNDDQEVARACLALMESCGLESVLATRSEAGMTLVDSGGARHYFGATAREVFDVTGAGDTVVAVLGAALAAGFALPDAARLANTAAGVAVGKLGTAAVSKAELRQALRAEALMAAEAKVSDLDSLDELATLWRGAGHVIGLTNGCFDLLHPGHLALLRQARAACDRLVVALNSDDSAQRLKGEGRPVQGEAARAAVLASLSDVDRVVIFTEDTPLRLIERLRPDVLVKGADYRLDQVVGADMVQSYGDRILLAELLPGYSTSETIGKIS